MYDNDYSYMIIREVVVCFEENAYCHICSGIKLILNVRLFKVSLGNRFHHSEKMHLKPSLINLQNRERKMATVLAFLFPCGDLCPSLLTEEVTLFFIAHNQIIWLSINRN